MKNLLITGGSGYVGSRLIFKLLKETKLKIVNYDISLFGDSHLPKSDNFIYCKEDITNPNKFEQPLVENKIDIVLHLACISNDPTYELNSELSKKINFDCFEDLVKISKKNNVKKFIYASTCSVYGISDSPNVIETNELKPITDYNKYKALCEPVLNKYIDDEFTGIIIRPATVCGFSEKMRFDLTVNILTNFAYNKGFIKVFGGKQSRPNLHIDDMCDLYKKLICEDIRKFNGEIFNVGTENLKIMEVAEKVKSVMEKKLNKKNIEIRVEESADIRSYMINSDKIKKSLGFKFKKSVNNAIEDLCTAFDKGLITDSFSDQWSNIKVLSKIEKKNKNDTNQI
jgi:nucleoside-diphosphate-sugar epimerase